MPPPVAWAHSRFNRPSRPGAGVIATASKPISTICARSAPSRWPMATGFSTASARSHSGGRRRPRHLRPRRNPAVDRACRWRRTRPHPRRRQCRRGGRPSLCRRSRKRTSSRTARDRLPHRTGTADCTHLAYVPADTKSAVGCTPAIWRPPCPNRRCALNRCKPSLCARALVPTRRCRDSVKSRRRLESTAVLKVMESRLKRPAVIAACRVPTTANDQRWARRWDLMAHLDAIVFDVISKIDNHVGDRLYFDKAGQRTGA